MLDSATRDMDVIVIGSGAAGLAAALAASEAGAERILVAEAEGIIGGSSRLSGGLMMGAGTRYQRALGIEDDWEALFHDYMTLNMWQVEAGVVERLTQRAGAAVEWLGDLGVEFVTHQTDRAFVGLHVVDGEAVPGKDAFWLFTELLDARCFA